MATDTQPLYLEKVTLSGYKSIENVEVDLMPGLNIIIGKNAAGKTNFLEFLDRSLKMSFDGFPNFYSKLLINASKKLEITSSNKSNKKIPDTVEGIFNRQIHTNISIGESAPIEVIQKFKFLEDNKDYCFQNTFVYHGTPKNYHIVEKPLSFTVEKVNNFSSELLNIMSIETENPTFIKKLAVELLLSIKVSVEEFKHETIGDQIISSFDSISNVKQVLSDYSPIQDFRINGNFNIFINDDKKSFTVTNLFFEFNINNNWLPYTSLSDGTKRIFYIISEILSFNDTENLTLKLTNFGTIALSNTIPEIILIEEPELGVHPHQFKKIMDFLKEQSRTKQIILSTHSPQALNVLDKEDLNRIIIAYATPDGTKLKHLDEQEIDKARAYIDEVFLSDYWLYSDLEKDTIS